MGERKLLIFVSSPHALKFSEHNIIKRDVIRGQNKGQPNNRLYF